MIPTLISTQSSTGNTIDSIEITTGIDNTYDHHLIVVTGWSPQDVHKYCWWQWNASGESGYNESWVGTQFYNSNRDNDASYNGFGGGYMWPSSDGVTRDMPFGGYYHDSGAGVCQAHVHAYNWGGTGFYKHYQAITKYFTAYDHRQEGTSIFAGWIQSTNPITGIKWKMTDSHTTGNGDGGITDFDIVLDLYGIE